MIITLSECLLDDPTACSWHHSHKAVDLLEETSKAKGSRPNYYDDAPKDELVRLLHEVKEDRRRIGDVISVIDNVDREIPSDEKALQGKERTLVKARLNLLDAGLATETNALKQAILDKSNSVEELPSSLLKDVRVASAIDMYNNVVKQKMRAATSDREDLEDTLFIVLEQQRSEGAVSEHIYQLHKQNLNKWFRKLYAAAPERLISGV